GRRLRQAGRSRSFEPTAKSPRRLVDRLSWRPQRRSEKQKRTRLGREAAGGIGFGNSRRLRSGQSAERTRVLESQISSEMNLVTRIPRVRTLFQTVRRGRAGTLGPKALSPCLRKAPPARGAGLFCPARTTPSSHSLTDCTHTL